MGVCAVGAWLVRLLRDRSPSTATEPLPRDGGVRGWRMTRPVYVAKGLSVLPNEMSYDAISSNVVPQPPPPPPPPTYYSYFLLLKILTNSPILAATCSSTT
eukprot:scaffold8287_cov36-Tisochrysis_lutea.AAC.7